MEAQDTLYHVFVDESGNTNLGDKSKYQRFYVAAAIIVKGSDVANATAQLDRISKEFNNGRPFKSSNIRNDIDRRIALLEKFSDIPFYYKAFAYDKEKIDDTSGLQYKQSFYKNLNQHLYENVAQTYGGKINVYMDSHGSLRYQESAKKYFEMHCCDLFSREPIKFFVVDDAESRLVQLADIIAGSLRLFLIGDKERAEQYSRMRKLLRTKEISLNCWPIQYDMPETIPIAEETSENDKRIAKVMIDASSKLILTWDKSDKPEDGMKAQVLRRLIEAKMIGESVYCDALMELVNKGNEKKIGRKAFLSDIIGSIRRNGIIITGTHKGYRLATTSADVKDYLQHDNMVIEPMLSKLKCAREKMKALADIDIANMDSSGVLKQLLDSISDFRVKSFAEPVEIDDERVVPQD